MSFLQDEHNGHHRHRRHGGSARRLIFGFIALAFIVAMFARGRGNSLNDRLTSIVHSVSSPDEPISVTVSTHLHDMTTELQSRRHEVTAKIRDASGKARGLAREMSAKARRLSPELEGFKHRVLDFTQRHDRGSWRWMLLSAGVLTAFLYVAFLFLDAATGGHFTWKLRFLWVIGLGGALLFLAL